jgi:hypothetical protein
LEQVVAFVLGFSSDDFVWLLLVQALAFSEAMFFQVEELQ